MPLDLFHVADEQAVQDADLFAGVLRGLTDFPSPHSLPAQPVEPQPEPALPGEEVEPKLSEGDVFGEAVYGGGRAGRFVGAVQAASFEQHAASTLTPEDPSSPIESSAYLGRTRSSASATSTNVLDAKQAAESPPAGTSGLAEWLWKPFGWLKSKIPYRAASPTNAGSGDGARVQPDYNEF